MSGVQLLSIVGMAAAAYLAGGIPFGLLLGRARGIDIRRGGSGNIGATNVGRLLGWRYFAIALILDAVKGFVPVILTPVVWRASGAWTPLVSSGWAYTAWLGVGAAAIAGHVLPVYLGFRGGRGVATSLGVVLGIWPYLGVPGLICFAIWIAIVAITRYVSLASIGAAVAFPIVYTGIATARGWGALGAQRGLLAFSVAIAVLVVYRHRSNIRRLLAGQENRFGSRASHPGKKTVA